MKGFASGIDRSLCMPLNQYLEYVGALRQEIGDALTAVANTGAVKVDGAVFRELGEGQLTLARIRHHAQLARDRYRS
jgi:hypothetical protein